MGKMSSYLFLESSYWTKLEHCCFFTNNAFKWHCGSFPVLTSHFKSQCKHKSVIGQQTNNKKRRRKNKKTKQNRKHTPGTKPQNRRSLETVQSKVKLLCKRLRLTCTWCTFQHGWLPLLQRGGVEKGQSGGPGAELCGQLWGSHGH